MYVYSRHLFSYGGLNASVQGAKPRGTSVVSPPGSSRLAAFIRSFAALLAGLINRQATRPNKKTAESAENISAIKGN